MKSTFYCLLIISFLTTGCSVRRGLVGEYLFDRNATDTSGKNHHGTVSGATLTTDRYGKSDGAYLFNGKNNDRITIGNNDDMNFGDNDDFTISLWVQVDPNQIPEGGINDIIRKWNGDTQGYPFAIAYLNGNSEATHKNRFIYVRYDGSGCRNAPTSYSPPLKSYEAFHHIVLVKEKTKIRQYLDNKLIEEFDDNTSCGTKNNADITLGCRGQLVRYFSGKIDDLRIYNRALKQKEINKLFKH